MILYLQEVLEIQLVMKQLRLLDIMMNYYYVSQLKILEIIGKEQVLN